MGGRMSVEQGLREQIRILSIAVENQKATIDVLKEEIEMLTVDNQDLEQRLALPRSEGECAALIAKARATKVHDQGARVWINRWAEYLRKNGGLTDIQWHRLCSMVNPSHVIPAHLLKSKPARQQEEDYY